MLAVAYGMWLGKREFVRISRLPLVFYTLLKNPAAAAHLLPHFFSTLHAYSTSGIYTHYH